jgi:hypothetical protein
MYMGKWWNRCWLKIVVWQSLLAGVLAGRPPAGGHTLDQDQP